MGETIRGGYYRGIDGKHRDANGNVVDGGEGEKWAKDREKAQLKAAEKESGRSVREIQAESEEQDQRDSGDLPRGAETPVPSATDPGPLGPQVFHPPAEATKHAEESGKKEGVRGGKTGKK